MRTVLCFIHRLRLAGGSLLSCRGVTAGVISGILAAPAASMAAEAPAMKRTQTVTLTEGWNAVFLEVEPMDTAPGKVFAGLPVDIAAAYFPHEAPTQFVTNPGTKLFKGLGWGVWYAESRPDAFLKTLNAIYGQQAYLIHATRAVEWKVDGLVSLPKARWQPDSFNLTGFSVKKQGGPTFAEFFAASPAHRGQSIYRLDQNVWKKVVDPAAASMRSGEAFWVFSKGGSDYQGPFSVETAAGQSLLELGSGSNALIFRNHTDHPVTPLLEHVAPDAKPVPLSINVRVTGDHENTVKFTAAEKPASAWQQAMPAIEGGSRLGIPFSVRTAEMTAPEQVSLLKITTDMGTEIWVPVLGRRPDLEKK
jgi:hypothetical protein